MAYVSGFTHDIFVSYASVDNEPDAQDVRWVSRFRGDLETALRQRLGKDVKIFFDQADLHAYHDLEELIRNARDSAIFLVVFSPSYVERQWPLAELRAFDKAAHGASGERNRIVTIEILPVEADRFPTEIENLKRTRFYYEDKDSRTEYKLTPVSAPGLYNERVQQFAHHLVLLLRGMRERQKSERVLQVATAAVPPNQVAVAFAAGPNKSKTVLLAQVTDDLYDERQKIVAYLEDYGVKVIPEGEYPESGVKFAHAVSADLERADLFVQLLGRVRSTKPDDLRTEGEQPKSYAQFQYDAALRRDIPVLQWRHPDIKPDKLPPNNWDRHLLDSSHVRVMGLQEFMKEIWTTVSRLGEEAKPGKGDFFFINADRSDQDLAQILLDAFKANNRNAFVPMYEGSAKEIEADLEESFIGCKGLLLVYGKSSLGWVRAQLRRFIKLEDRRQEPLRVKTILCGPPPAKPEVGVSGFDVIDCQDGTAAERVQKIIKELQL
jgi:hypothetical protein